MKKTLIVLLVALIASTAVFAQGATEAKSEGPMTITMLYAATQTEVGSLPDDWAGYQILRDKL
ncbi:MAG: ABC transporter substrate-binding protein, partial [Spirochaetales bacterium]|nr:ABC transporter substrate-binding protein [Spirochaetales bacterium]